MATFARSPALHATRPSALIDPHHPADYPVLLGDAFKDSKNDLSTSLSMRYNWKAQKPGPVSRMHIKGRKSDSGDAYELRVEDQHAKDRPYRYVGRISETSASKKSGDKSEASGQSLALVWNPAKSAFILEPISASLDFNLTSGPDQTQRDIDSHKMLPGPASKQAGAESEAPTGSQAQASDSDSDPDASNPYDFRHFLAEARESISNGTQNTRSRTPVPGSRTPVPGSRTPIPGGRTPVPGSHTPLPGLSSPTLSALASTPKFHATSGPTPKKRKLDRSPNPTSNPTRKPKPQPATRKPAEAKRAQPLSAERIIDSDEEADESVVEPRSTAPTNHRQALSALNSPPSQPDRPPSPHLIVSDADAELEIDMGSPPLRERFTQRKRQHVNPDAFRHRSNNTPRRDEEDVEMTDADVEELELGSPRSGVASRRISMVGKGPEEAEMEDDDGLAAELAAALEEEEEDETVGGVGLGIGMGGGGKQGDGEESEVSEEE